MGLRAVVAAVGLALYVLAVSCGQSTSSAKAPTSAAPSTASVVSRPSGGPVPAALVGDWFQPQSVVRDFDGNSACVLLRLTLTATTSQVTHTALGICGSGGSGDVIVNQSEIDFYNGSGECADAVDRATWRITTGLLYFTSISTPCRAFLALHNAWSRAS